MRLILNQSCQYTLCITIDSVDIVKLVIRCLTCVKRNDLVIIRLLDSKPSCAHVRVNTLEYPNHYPQESGKLILL